MRYETDQIYGEYPYKRYLSNNKLFFEAHIFDATRGYLEYLYVYILDSVLIGSLF